MRGVALGTLFAALVFLGLNTAFRFFDGDMWTVAEASYTTLIFALVYGGGQLIYYWMKERKR
ncbi:hypothetical protein [Marivita sp. S2033]|uniref:hypothetical protein n=1 Tax=Marivita sp. S2033 TaxID=3373187 RepID=UPI0039824A68